ncbi:unnamed protein product [Symbiodinium natans]|uniref:Uncharacterized protein n=1 Tax=Symbiodinium natans TaxID=878477 RepID=A0A812IF34_9DINO|nr:unnamed protein product [Symbiodinium natans]
MELPQTIGSPGPNGPNFDEVQCERLLRERAEAEVASLQLDINFKISRILMLESKLEAAETRCSELERLQAHIPSAICDSGTCDGESALNPLAAAEHFEKLFKETSDRYEVLFKEIGDRYRAARKQGIESFDGADYYNSVLQFSKAIWMLELWPEVKRPESWAPGMAEILVNRGLAHVKHRQWELAEADFTEGLKLHPEATGLFGAETLSHRAVVAEKLGHLTQSLQDAEGVLRIKPDAEDMRSLMARMVSRIIAGVTRELVQAEDLETRHRLWRSLILTWHPDKHPDRPTGAAEVCKHLNSLRQLVCH